MPWWGWLLVSLFTVLVGLFLRIRYCMRELANAFLSVMVLPNLEWEILKEQATKTEGT